MLLHGTYVYSKNLKVLKKKILKFFFLIKCLLGVVYNINFKTSDCMKIVLNAKKILIVG